MFSRYRWLTSRQMSRQIAARLRGTILPPRRHGNALIFHSGRSGSTLLGNMLDQNPEIFWDGETLERPFHQLAHAKKTSIEAQFGRLDLQDAVDRIVKRKRRLAGGRIYGFELQDYQLEMLDTTLPQFLDAVVPLGFDRIIVLNRRNHLRKIVSHMIATTHKRHHVAGGPVRTVPSVRVNPDRCFVGHRQRTLLGALDSYDSFFRELDGLLADKETLRLDYDEDISENPSAAYRKCCAFLDVPASPARVGLGKTADFPLSDLIENYPDVAAALAGTPHAWMAPRPL